jgi:signal transduction histidine kinase
MREHERTARRMVATGAAVLVVTLAALGAAARTLVSREEATEREQSRRTLEATVARAVVTCILENPDTDWLTVDFDREGRFERPAERPFAPLPAPDHAADGPRAPIAADTMLEEAERSGDPRMVRAWVNLMIVGDDAVVRLRAAARGALLDDDAVDAPPAAAGESAAPSPRDWRAEARIPPELADTAEAVLLGVRAGDRVAIDRAWQTLGSADEDRAAAMLVRWPRTEPAGNREAVTGGLRRNRRWLQDRAVVGSVAPTLPVRDWTVPGVSPKPRARIALLADGTWIEGFEQDHGGWRYIRHADPRGAEDLATALAKDGVRLVRADSADGLAARTRSDVVTVPLDLGWLAVQEQAPVQTGRGSLLAAGLAIAAGAAILAFVFFARSVRRESAASAARADFVATASHELRTPIAVMRTAAETLLAGRAPREDDRSTLLRAVLRESEHLSSLVGNLLDFTRMDAGTRRYAFRETDPVSVVQETVQRTSAASAGTGFRVWVDAGTGVGTLRADPDALGGAIANLLDNAAKFRDRSQNAGRDGPGDGAPPCAATVRVRGDAASVTIEVEDHGIGIAPADRAHVFERFFRSQDPRVRETRGAGIGLALVRHAVEAHRGTVEILDTPGGGTTFRLVLPRDAGGAPS